MYNSEDQYMTYRGYRAEVRYSHIEDCLIGNVLDIDDKIVAVGDSVSELEADFHRKINEYELPHYKDCTLHYKNYDGTVEYDHDNQILFGKVLGTTDCLLYEGRSFTKLRKDFEETVDGYIDLCDRVGKQHK
jgi:predicted HicB family RNase H-like nuclease